MNGPVGWQNPIVVPAGTKKVPDPP
jgi:hypothetical protein